MSKFAGAFKGALDEERKWLVHCMCKIPVNLRSSTGFGNSDEIRKLKTTAATSQEAEQKAVAYYKRAGYIKVTVTRVEAQ